VAASGQIDRRRCREVVEFKFSMERMARDHANYFRSVIEDHRYNTRRSRLVPGGRPAMRPPRQPARVIRSGQQRAPIGEDPSELGIVLASVRPGAGATTPE
jgi:hypothetical protein